MKIVATPPGFVETLRPAKDPLSTKLPLERVPSTQVAEGSLVGLLDARNARQAELDKAERNLQEFLAAFQIVTVHASGKFVDLKQFPEGVQRWVGELEKHRRETISEPVKVEGELRVCGWDGCLVVLGGTTGKYCRMHHHQARRAAHATENAET